MRILIIDGSDKTALTYVLSFENLNRIITTAVSKCCVDLSAKSVINPEFIYRRFDDLDDFLFDWEAKYFDSITREKTRAFDSLDIIIVNSDVVKSNSLPWSSSSQQLKKLLFLSDICSKYVLTCGGATLTSLLAIAVGADHVEILNKPMGNSLKDLPSFSVYKHEKNVLTGCWLDNETGDLYSYNSSGKSWMPVCNVGCHRILSNDIKNSSESRLRWINYSGATMPVEPLGVGQVICRIRSKHVQHFCWKGIHDIKEFRVKMIPDWTVNRDIALPISKGVQVLAESERGPVVLSHGTRLMLACEVDYLNPQCKAVQIIISNFISHAMKAVISENKSKISLSVKVFGSAYHQLSASFFYKPDFSMPEFHDTILAQPLASRQVMSTVHGGPTLIEEGPLQRAPTVLEPQPPPPLPKYLNIHNTVNHSFVQYPEANRTTRLKTLIQNSGYTVNESILFRSTGIGAGLKSPRTKKSGRPQSAAAVMVCSGRQACTGNSTSGQNLSNSTRRMGWDKVLYSDPATAPKSPRINDDNKRLHITSKEAKFDAVLDDMLYFDQHGDDFYQEIDAEEESESKNDADIIALAPETIEQDKILAEPIRNTTSQTTPPVESLSPRVRTKGVCGNPNLKYDPVSIAQQAEGLCLRVFHPQVGETPQSSRRLKHQLDKLAPPARTRTQSAKAGRQETGGVSAYEGAYSEVFRTPYEKEKHEEKISNAKAIDGPFKRHFGKASRLPLRREGLVRPQGPYLGKTFHDYSPKQNCNDWTVSRVEEPTKRLSGPWKK